MPMRSTGSASVTNSRSSCTASATMARAVASSRGLTRWLRAAGGRGARGFWAGALCAGRAWLAWPRGLACAGLPRPKATRARAPGQTRRAPPRGRGLHRHIHEPALGVCTAPPLPPPANPFPPVQEAGEVCVQPLVPGDELVREGKPRHEAALLEPEDGTEAAAEVDALHARERQQALREGRAAAGPAQRPVRLAADDGDGVDRAQQGAALGGVPDVALQQEGVHLWKGGGLVVGGCRRVSAGVGGSNKSDGGVGVRTRTC